MFKTFHQHLDHHNHHNFQYLVYIWLIPCANYKNSISCHSCQLGKNVCLPFNLSISTTTSML